VHAFVRLAAELRAHGAPRDLIERARRAASDEVRHARVTGALARRWGAIVPKVVVAVEAPRALEAIAVENAVEGCVGETWGALIATWQGERAGDEGIRDAMRAIADDELGHATLAWDVAAWIEPLLDEAERSRVVAARRDAARELARLVDEEQPPSLVTDLGLPSRERAGALLAGALVLWT
jgi:Mn-containing catalase